MGPMPVYRMTHEGHDVAVAHPGLCAPFAAAVLEELIAFGGRKFVACGSAGVLGSDLAKGTVVVPSGAVRDEGTSYHYVAPVERLPHSRMWCRSSRRFWSATECRSKSARRGPRMRYTARRRDGLQIGNQKGA